MSFSSSCQECSPTTHEPRKLIPRISFCYGSRSYFLIGQDTIRALDNPEYITLLVNWEVPSVAIMECQPGDNMSFKVPERKSYSNTFRIHSKSFIRRLFSVLECSMEKVVSFQGIYDSEKKAVIFDLSSYKVTDKSLEGSNGTD
ncbi:MAG: hypothetical protein J5768_05410 [Spirochaetales bacterium]|nr:hypothetical protein [Spirochaetales bacterium]